MKLTIWAVLLSVISSISFANGVEKVTVCGHSNYPPFMWNEEGNTVGVGVDVATAIFQELDIEVVAKSIGNWKRCLAMIESGKVDLVVAAYRTDERMKYAQYTETPLSEDSVAIFVWKGKEFKFDEWRDLIGKKAGVISGDSIGQKFDLFLEKHVKFEEVPSRMQNFIKLERGRIDFFPMGVFTGAIHLKRYGYSEKIVALKNPIIKNHLYMAFSNKSKYLSYLPQLEAGLQKWHEDGRIEALIKENIDYFAQQTGTNKK